MSQANKRTKVSPCHLLSVVNHGYDLRNRLGSWMTEHDLKMLSQSAPKLLGDMTSYRRYVHLRVGSPIRDLGLLYGGLLEVKLDDTKVLHQLSKCGRVILTRSTTVGRDETCVSATMRERRPLDAFSTVEKLDISSMTSSLRSTDVTTILGYFPVLRKLVTSSVDFEANAFEDMLKALPCTMRVLDVSNVGIGFTSFNALPSGLRVLNMNAIHLGNSEMSSLAIALSRCGSLEEFHAPSLVGNNTATYINLFNVLATYTPQLKALIIQDGWRITVDVAAEILRVVRQCVGIQILNITLWNGDASHLLFQGLSKTPPVALTHLILRGHVGDSFQFLPDVFSRCQLQTLEIVGRWGTVMPETFHRVLQATPSIRSLHLQGRLQDFGQGFKYLSKLEHLRLYNTTSSKCKIGNLLDSLPLTLHTLRVIDFDLDDEAGNGAIRAVVQRQPFLEDIETISITVVVRLTVWLSEFKSSRVKSIVVPKVSSNELCRFLDLLASGYLPDLQKFKTSVVCSKAGYATLTDIRSKLVAVRPQLVLDIKSYVLPR